jgi:hypothetical protein
MKDPETEYNVGHEKVRIYYYDESDTYHPIVKKEENAKNKIISFIKEFDRLPNHTNINKKWQIKIDFYIKCE